MEKIAAYVRVSDHNESARAAVVQSMKIEEYCKSHGYQACVSALTVGTYEEAFPAFQNLWIDSLCTRVSDMPHRPGVRAPA